MNKHFLKSKKVFTNIAFSPLILLANNSEIVAKYLPNEFKQSITTFEIKDNNNYPFEDGIKVGFNCGFSGQNMNHKKRESDAF